MRKMIPARAIKILRVFNRVKKSFTDQYGYRWALSTRQVKTCGYLGAWFVSQIGSKSQSILTLVSLAELSEFCACQIAGVESGTNRIFSLQLNAPDRLNLPSKTLNHSVFPALIFWSALSVILHAFYINTPFVNLEYVFAQATQSLLDPETKQSLSIYFSMQANPMSFFFPKFMCKKFALVFK